MHILAGESALRAVRAVRYRGLSVPLERLGPARRRAYLPGQEPQEDGDASVTPWEVNDFAEALRAEPTLEAAGIDFAAVESNARADLWYLGDIGNFNEERYIFTS